MKTDAEMINMWLDGKSAATKRTYGHMIKELADYCDKPLGEINSSDLFRFKATLVERSANSIKLYVNTIKSLFAYCVKDGYIEKNPATQMIAPKVESRIDERILTQQEITAIVTHAKTLRDRLLIRFLYETGMRISEACSLTWRNFRTTDASCAVSVVGKGNKRRTIYFSLAFWDELQTIRTSDGPVFRSRKGGHLDPSQGWRIVRAAAQSAGLKGNVSPHWFRHSHASHALENGASLMAVRDTLGHANATITDRYLHSQPGTSSSFYITH